MTGTCGADLLGGTPAVAKQASFNGSAQAGVNQIINENKKMTKLNNAFTGGGQSGGGNAQYTTQDATCKNGYFKMLAHANPGAAAALTNHSVMQQFVTTGGGRHKRSRHKRSRHKRSRHKRSVHKRSRHKRSVHKRSRHKRSRHKRSRHKRSRHKRSRHKRSVHKRSRSSR
jgi:hypothetical protein